MNSALLDCVEVDPPGKPAATIIWLHGLGADGHDFEAIVPDPIQHGVCAEEIADIRAWLMGVLA